ncbi:DUF4232 domain-containing protein [Brevundimonas sp.]|uniref:DUF4232 domain-containing protein n=1 Tax=Brevundimonas sp. TaxID=1871086 RepID=UPI002FC85480
MKLLLLLPVLAACQQPAPEDKSGQLKMPQATASAPVRYTCGAGGDVVVAYDEGGVAHLTLDGQTMDLMTTSSPRGSAYSDGHLRWEIVNEAGQEIASLTLADGTVRRCVRPSPTAAPAPSLTACRADQLQMEAGEADAAMGHRQQEMRVSLKGATGCILPQWPELALEPSKGVTVERTTDGYFGAPQGQDRIEMKPDQTVRFYLGWGVIPHEYAGEKKCPEITGWSLKAPGGGQLASVPASVPASMTACGGKVTVSAFVTDADARDGAP